MSSLCVHRLRGFLMVRFRRDRLRPHHIGQRHNFPLVFLQRRQRHLRVLRIRPMHGLAVVTQGQLREPFGIADDLRAFRPRVTVAVQRHALNAKPDTALLELCRPVARAHSGEIRKQGARLWEGCKDVFDFLPKPDLRRLLTAPARFHPHEANDPCLPIHVLGL